MISISNIFSDEKEFIKIKFQLKVKEEWINYHYLAKEINLKETIEALRVSNLRLNNIESIACKSMHLTQDTYLKLALMITIEIYQNSKGISIFRYSI